MSVLLHQWLRRRNHWCSQTNHTTARPITPRQTNHTRQPHHSQTNHTTSDQPHHVRPTTPQPDQPHHRQTIHTDHTTARPTTACWEQTVYYSTSSTCSVTVCSTCIRGLHSRKKYWFPSSDTRYSTVPAFTYPAACTSRTASASIAALNCGSNPIAGASSTTFCRRFWTEQSRSHR